MKEMTKSSFPLFGILSLLPPLLNAASLWFLDHSPNATRAANGYAGMFLAAFLLVGMGLLSIVGFGCGIAALVRRERFWFLGLVGMAGIVLVWSRLK
jgi:hypothetical protein